MKKMISMLMILLVMFVCTSALAEDTLLVTAKTLVPATATLVKTDWDDGAQEYVFWNAATEEEYEVQIERTGKVFSVTSERRSEKGGASVALTEQQAKDIVLAECAGATIQYVSVESNKKGNDNKYIVIFQADGIWGAYNINAETGVILERDTYYEQMPGAFAAWITPADAVKKIVETHPSAEVLFIDLATDDMQIHYEGVAAYQGGRYEFEYPPNGGILLEFSRD